MIAARTFRHRRVAVLGLGRSGRASVRALRSGGAEVLAWDDAPAARAALATEDVSLVDLAGTDWSAIDALVLSPGIPLHHPEPHPAVVCARAAGVEVIGDVELLARERLQARYVGVTGTNGKSTTTALIAHLLRALARPVAMGGNIGVPVLDLDPPGANGVFVLEMSSYQLELTAGLAFDVAVLLNLSPDHIDRHGDMAGYVAAKRRIFTAQRADQTAVVAVDDAPSRDLANDLRAADRQRVIAVSGGTPVPGGIYVHAGHLVDDSDGRARTLADLGGIATLTGAHNHQNAAAAFAAVHALGDIDGTQTAMALADFPGLAHRLELVAEIDGIRLINDSKATNADAAARALASYDVIYWIAGGIAKAGGIDVLAPYFPRIAHAFLIGDAADAFARTLSGRVAHTCVGELKRALPDALALARRERRAGAVILLSPACASFDQWRDFEVRGDAFRTLARALAASEA